MPDPIRVTRAVKACEHDGALFPDAADYYPCPICGDTGWVDVPVDEQCPTCRGVGFIYTSGGVWSGEDGVPHVRSDGHDCPDCGGSGRRLHDWATGWCVGDELLIRNQADPAHEYDFPQPYYTTGVLLGWPDGFDAPPWVDEPAIGVNAVPLEHIVALVLSDPGHRPEPMRWKQ